MNIGIIGLGLIGGSMARAFKKINGITVWGMDKNSAVIESAVACGAVDGPLTDSKMELCDYIIISLYPQDTMDFIKLNYHRFRTGAVIMDTCGVKEIVCNEIFPLAAEEGFVFIGTHPMAGIEESGFDNSFSDLFKGASLILVTDNADIPEISKVKELFKRIGFDRIEFTSGVEHDRMIAYTSQMAHVVSSAYVKNPDSSKHRGFSAGSFQDMTRVAKLNEKMWVELFLDNKENLVESLDNLICELGRYREAVFDSDRNELYRLLHEGRQIREEITNNDI